MKSKIDISYPFTDMYDCAYKVSSQGRNTIVLYSTVTRQRTSISYARYLMSVHLKRLLQDFEQVDHINNDRADDRIENLQILKVLENNRKQASTNGCKMVEYKCPVCGVHFSVKYSKSHFILGNKSMTCSRKCGGKSSWFEVPIQIVVREYNWYDEHHFNEQVGRSRYLHI